MIKSEQDILDISNILFSIIDKYNMESINIIDTMPSYYLLKLDEELWRKFNPDKKFMLKKVENEEIIINRGRIKFHLKGDGDYNYPIKKDIYGYEYIQENNKNNK